MKEKTRKILGISLLVIGLLGLSSNFVINYIGEKKNESLIENFEWTEPSVEDDFFAEVDSKEQEEDLFKKNVIAVLSVPSVGIRYPVVKGTDAETLKKALGYFEDTAMPGEIGNFCVAGHRNSSYARYFNRLDEVKTGDEIIVETRTDRFTYVVTDSFKIHENQVEVLDQSDKREITLITCTNGYKPKHRIVVKGKIK